MYILSLGHKVNHDVFQGHIVCSVGHVCSGYISWTRLYEGQAEVGLADASHALVILSGRIQVRRLLSDTKTLKREL